jgi:hypothetical protein
MSTETIPHGAVEVKPRVNRRFDRQFFTGMAIAMLVFVLIGFARSYYLAGVFHSPPLPNVLVHVHGALFTAWILLFVTQTSLVASHRVDLHRRLGAWGVSLAAAMVVVGLVTAIDSEARHFEPGDAGVETRAFFTVTISLTVLFGTFVYLAYRNRMKPAAHKRYMLLATITLMDAAFQRFPVPASWWGPEAAALLCTIPLVAILAAYDYWSSGKVHRVTLWAGALIIALQQIRSPLGHTAVWQQFALWVQTHARGF